MLSEESEYYFVSVWVYIKYQGKLTFLENKYVQFEINSVLKLANVACKTLSFSVTRNKYACLLLVVFAPKYK